VEAYVSHSMAAPELCRNFLSGVCGRQGRKGTVEVRCPVSTAALRSGPLLRLRLHGGVARHCRHYCLVVRPVAADATLALLVEAQRRSRQVEQLITAAPP